MSVQFLWDFPVTEIGEGYIKNSEKVLYADFVFVCSGHEMETLFPAVFNETPITKCKLLKQAGHDVEAWLQTTPQAILRRLLISSMACVLTWRVQRGTDEQNVRIRAFLTRISGRQQKRGKLESAPTILAGLSILLSTLQLLSEYSPDELNAIAKIAFDL